MAYLGNNNFNNFGQMQQQLPKFNTVLSKGEINELKNSGKVQSETTLTKEEALRALCTHRDGDKVCLVDQSDGSVVCSICGERFYMTLDKVTQEQVNTDCEAVNSYIQSAKVFSSLPEEDGRSFLMALGMLKKVPNFYKTSSVILNKYRSVFGNNGNGRNQQNSWSEFARLMGGAFQPSPNYFMQQQPQQYYQPQQYQPQFPQMQPQQRFSQPMPAAPVMRPQMVQQSADDKPIGVVEGNGPKPQANPITKSFKA